ncbi:MAG TPA: ABC transporter substrate-binding protein [Stellaceae bacterium]|nr:ABC transporter substrate-binding protein [Stellaceae bacterium]
MVHRTRLAALLLAGGLALCAALPARAETKIVEGYVSPGAPEWPEYVGLAFGWFKDNGIALDMVGAGAGAAQQVTAGSIDLGYSGFPDFIYAINRGAPIKIIVNGLGAPPYGVYAKPAIKTVADLKGKIISIGGPKDVTLIYIEALLATAGLSAKDCDFFYAKMTQDRFAALISGGADAAILYPPASFRAGRQGYTFLGDIGDLLKDFPFTVIAVNDGFAAKNRTAVEAYVRTYSRAVAWLYDTKNKDKAVEILAKATKQDVQDSADTYDYFFAKLQAFSRNGLITDTAYKKMTDALISFGELKQPVPPLGKFFDASFVKAAWGK